MCSHANPPNNSKSLPPSTNPIANYASQLLNPSRPPPPSHSDFSGLIDFQPAWVDQPNSSLDGWYPSPLGSEWLGRATRSGSSPRPEFSRYLSADLPQCPSDFRGRECHRVRPEQQLTGTLSPPNSSPHAEQALPTFFLIPCDFIEQIAAMRVIEILTVMPRRPFLILGKIRSRYSSIPIP